MKLSENGLAFLSHEEGLRTTVYQDRGGLDTIGVGHLITDVEKATGAIIIGGIKIPYLSGLTLPQVQALYAQDVAPKEAAVSSLIVCPLTQNQFDALCSLAFNIGIPHFTTSSARYIINGGDWTDLEAHWKLWNHDGGTVDPELVGRRDREWQLWSTPT